jgi:hypothetical protein
MVELLTLITLVEYAGDRQEEKDPLLDLELLFLESVQM